ncbi:metallophosphoesterase [Diaphorobacter sp. HDW4A]|uniref:metallophosphoesterase n=1 Tax=Diaphorobacter sp. HDW4A TaxID=2714924 RepID=UPI00140CBE9D|nr:metallophosphoesterase [Diaphorobacter sp. HDW4A]QIL82646.1 metallophosphoesterase [Diaphorobacter sp. HDW4A]
MRLQFLSDLHLETHPQFQPSPAPGADVLVLAGDVGSYQQGSRLTSEYFGLERFSPLPQFAHWPTPVIFVPGNHEYDGLDFDDAHERLKRSCERLGLIWLERKSLEMNGVRFVGTTLWSDFDALAQDDVKSHPARYLQKREKAFRAANFYLRKTGGTRGGEPYLAEQVREQSLVCQEWLTHALMTPSEADRTVVITHFAPSLLSADPRYGLVPGTAGFCNALDYLLPYADLWIHGHLHAPSDYIVTGPRADGSSGKCRVLANPLGYAVKGEQETFQPHRCVDI